MGVSTIEQCLQILYHEFVHLNRGGRESPFFDDLKGCAFMGRPPLPEDERKEQITLRLKSWVIKDLKKIENYNQLVEDLVIKYLKKN